MTSGDRIAEIEGRLASTGPTHADMLELLAEIKRLREALDDCPSHDAIHQMIEDALSAQREQHARIAESIPTRPGELSVLKNTIAAAIRSTGEG